MIAQQECWGIRISVLKVHFFYILKTDVIVAGYANVFYKEYLMGQAEPIQMSEKVRW